MGNMTQRASFVLSGILKAGLFILPALSLIVAGNIFGKIFLPGVGDLFFPFITGKNFFFRMMVEVLFVLWVVMMLFAKRYRPRRSPILWALTATIVVLTLSTIFGVNPYRSFWSNFERMEGLIGHLHLFVYFLILSCVLRKWKDWKWMFFSIISVSVIMTLYGYLQVAGKVAISQQSGVRLDGTFGNATYFGIFIIFHVFFLLYAALREQRTWLRTIFLLLLAAEVPIIFLTATRGSILGLFGGVVIFAVLAGLLNGQRRVRLASVGVIGTLAIFALIFWTVRDRPSIQNNYILGRFSNLSLKERTVESRFTIWGMALEGVKQRPLLGYGLENFNILFNTYYEPKLWRQEPWFDRAHNIVFDWLSHGGLLGLAAYLSIFASALYVLWSRYRKELHKGTLAAIAAPAALSALFTAYLFHNFFVFDNISSYYLFFTALGFVHFYYVEASGREETERREKYLPKFSSFFLGAAAVLLIFPVFYIVNVKPLLASRTLLRALQDISTQGRNVDIVLSDFNRTFSYRTFAAQEAREQLSGYANNVAASDLSQEAKIKVLNKAIEEMEKQAKESSEDARGFLFLSALYDRVGRSAEALDAAQKALALSPRKQQIFYVIADVYLRRNDGAKAQEILQEAYDLDRENVGAVKNLATVAILNHEQQYAEELLYRSFGTIAVSDPQLVNAYGQVGDFERVRDIWLKFIQEQPENAQYYINLAATYARLGDRSRAVEALESAIRLNPQFKTQGEQFIRELEAGAR